MLQALTAMTAAMLTLGVFQKGHCVANGWSNPDQFWRACYSDVPVLYSSTPGLAEGTLPYLDQGWDQPLLSGLAMWALSWLVPPGASGAAAHQWVFLIWVAVAFALLVLMLVALVSMMPTRPWHAAHLAVSPVIAVLALVSVDLVGVAALIWGIWFWRSGRAIPAGVLFGLAFLVRPLAAVVLLAIVLVAPRQHKVAAALRSLAAAAGTVLLLLAPFLLLNPSGALAPLRSWWLATPGYGAPALIPSLIATPLSAAGATITAVLGWLAALAVGLWLTRPAARRVNLIRVAAPMMVIVGLTSAALPVQVGLWLLPLIALSTIPWRDHLLWASAEILHFVAVWLYLGYLADPGRGLPPEIYALAIMVRAAGWLYIGWRISVPSGQATPALHPPAPAPDDAPGPRSTSPDRRGLDSRGAIEE